MKNYKIKIQEPCNENWNKMTPNEKGRFCDSCCKTVIDFTKKTNDEIKEYFLANRGNRICGHLKKSQLDSIVIQIPDTVFEQPLTFQKIFLLALLLTMGSVLFSCKTDGKTKNINKIELLDGYIYDADGYDKDGYDGNGFNDEGFDENGYDEDNINEAYKARHDKDNDDDDEYFEDYNEFNEEGTKITPTTLTVYDRIESKIIGLFDTYRFDENGYDKNGFNEDGLDINGYNWDEIDEAYNQDGFDNRGFDNRGFDKKGYDEYGYDRNGFNESGYDEDGNMKKDEYDGGMGLMPEIPPLYDEIGSKIVQLLSSLKEKNHDININISIDNLGENERISVKTVSEEIKQKIVRQLKSEIIPLIAVEVKKDSFCDFFEYNYKLTV